MNPGTYNITLTRGDTLRRLFRFKDQTTEEYIVLEDWTGRAQVRDGNDALVGTLEVAFQQDVTSWFVTIFTEDTQDWPVTSNLMKLYWDLELTNPDGDTTTYIVGAVGVRKDFTHD